MTLAPVVIAVSGPAGSGKTTVCKALADSLDAPTIFFDDYAGRSNLPTNLQKWLDDGADFNEWETPALVADLQKLKAGESIENPAGQTIESGPVIILENPLGCAHKALASCIDFLIFLDTPLEVALARFVLRELTSGAALTRFAATDEAERHAALQMYLQGYLSVFRHVYREQHEQVTASADYVVNADQSIEAIMAEIEAAVADKFSLPT